MMTCVWLLLAAWAPAAAAAEGGSIPQYTAFLQLKQAIEDQYYSYDRDGLQPLVLRARALIDQAPAVWYPHYYAGVLSILWGNITRAGDRDDAYRSYRQAQAFLAKAHAMAPSAETLLWMSAVYGKLASMRTLKMFYYGARSKAFMEEAHALSRGNPKFFMLAGAHMMHTPKLFGGGIERARDFLQRALGYADGWRDTDPLVVRWARPPEIWAHLAQAAVFAGQAPEARRYLGRALDVQPDYGFVIRDIRPQLERLEQSP